MAKAKKSSTRKRAKAEDLPIKAGQGRKVKGGADLLRTSTSSSSTLIRPAGPKN